MDSDNPVYCPICGEHPSPSNSEPGTIFQCFLKVFKVEWRGNSFSFCETCMSQLTLISDLQRDIQDLQKRLEAREKELQAKLKGSEAKFEKSLYSRDQRYFNLRKQIFGYKVSQPSSCSSESEAESSEQQQPFKVDSSSDNSLGSDDENDHVEFNKASSSEDDEVLPSQHRKRKRVLTINSDSEEDHDDDDDDDHTITDEDKQILRKKHSNNYVYKTSVTHHNCRLDRLPEGFYKCSECDAILANSRKILRSHVIKEHTHLHVCLHCSKRFECASKLKKHLKETHKMVPPEECPICFRPFFRTGSLKNHIWTHYSEQEKLEAVARDDEELPSFLNNDFKCDQCNRSFVQLSSLENHVKKKHGAEERVKKEKELCGICGAAVVNLHAHMRFKHTKEEDKKFECSVCLKRFAFNNHLQVHKKKAHSNEKNVQCDLCGRGFKFLRQMKEHRLGHEEVKPFSCNQCGMGFSRKQVMTRHMNIHEGIKRTDHKKIKKERQNNHDDCDD